MKLEFRKLLQMLGVLQPEKILYIGGSDVLPQPLAPAQEQTLLKAVSYTHLVGELELHADLCRDVGILDLLRFKNLQHNDVRVRHRAVVDHIVLAHQGMPLVLQDRLFVCHIEPPVIM